MNLPARSACIIVLNGMHADALMKQPALILKCVEIKSLVLPWAAGVFMALDAARIIV